jgi:putative ABC transport system permease protein
LLDEHDRAGAPLVALVSESLASRRLPGLDPIGRRIRIGDGELYTVVGIVGDVKQLSLAVNQPDAVYTTASQWRFAEATMSLVVRVHGDAQALAPAVRQAVWSVDKDQPVVRVATMDALVAATAAERRFVLTVFEVFALSALVLAAAGLYGVLAASVAERTSEIGVRAALGASRRDIVRHVVGQGMTLSGVGMAIGVVAAARAAHLTEALFFDISALDAVTYLAVVAIVTATALTACAVPAWRAARVDPVVALRVE